MDSNWNAAQSGAATGPSFGVGPDSNNNLDWRSQLQPDARQRIANKMMNTLKKHLPVQVPEDLSKLKKIAVQFEEQIYSAATCQPDYLRKIAQKIMSIEANIRIDPGQQPQQLTSQNQMLYHQQQLAMHHKLQQQQQQQQTQMQMSSALAGGSGMMSAAAAGGMQQSQLNSVQQQPEGQGESFQQQPLMRQQQQQPQKSQPMMQNPTRPLKQTNNVTDLQQQRLQMQRNQMQQNQMQQNQLHPNQMQQNQMMNQQMMLGQQQNLLMGSGGAGNMNKMQMQMQMQRNAGLQQQQPQHQQHLLSQLQSQQQQLPQQKQLSVMQMPQQQVQGSPAILQTQDSNAIDPQRQQQHQFIPQQQLQQQQRVPQDVASSPASMDYASQTWHQGDWQEEMYQRIKYLKDTYLPDLREVHRKLSVKLSELDSKVLPNTRGREQIEKMKHFKMHLERMMAVLQLGKQSMQIGLKDKLSLYEEQIVSILQNNKKASQQQPQAGASSDQPHFPALQQLQPGMQSQQLPQQQQPQQMDNQNQNQNQNQQQLSTRAMPQSNNLRMPNAMQQDIQNTLQSDQLQASGMGFGSLQQGAMGPTMQNTMNPPQMIGSGAAISSSIVPHTVTMAGIQTNMSSAQVLKPQQEHKEQQIQPQKHLMQQKQQKQQLVQQNQMQQLSEPSDPSDLKSRQGASGMKSGSMYQQNYPGMSPRNGYSHSQLKPGSNPPISSPQNNHSSSPQISHPSPQVDQQGLIPPTQLKSGTPLQAAASPSSPVIPSPMIEDTELGAGLMHNSAADQANSARTGQMGQPQAESLAIGTPGTSASQLPAEFTSPEARQGTILSIQVPESEKPIEKLARLMRTMPRNQLNAAVKDIASVVSMVDRIPGSGLGNGFQAGIDDDLVAHAEGVAGTSGRASPPTKKMKRDTSAMPLNSNNNEYVEEFRGGSFISKIIKWQDVDPEAPYVIV